MSRLAGWLRENGLTAAIAVALAVAYLLLRTPTDGPSGAEARREIEMANAAVVYFYSNT